MTIDQVLLQNLPAPLALLDSNLIFVDFSDEWLRQFGKSKRIKGKSFFDSMPDLPEELGLDIKFCLDGVNQRSDTKRIVLDDGSGIWYKWKINPWLEEGNVHGIIINLEDVTSLMLGEELLDRSIRVARIGGWELDTLANKIYWSQITKEIHEVDEDYVPNLKEGISFYKEGFSRETISAAVQKGIEQGIPWDEELQISTAKGNEVWVRAIGEPEMINGKCVRVIGTFQDIDKRRKTEIEYKKVSERLALATKTAGIGIWEYNVLEDRVLWDENMYTLYGIKKSEFKEGYKAWETCVLPEDLEQSSKAVKEALEGKKDLNITFRVKWPNGEIRWIKAEATIIRGDNGEALKIIGINEDITELKTVQLQLLKSEESLQGAFENSSVGMALVAMDGKFIKVNESLCESLGYTNKELLKLTFQDITHPDDLEIDLSLLKEVVEGKRTTYQIEKKYFNKKGNLVYVFLTVTAVKKINGDISHFISQIVDISSRIAAEDKLKGLLQVTTNQNNSLLNFAYIVSHNLRSHTANLSMITSFLLDKETSPEIQKESLGMLDKASRGLNETISHLNEVVQVKLGSRKKLKAIQLKRIVDKVLIDVAALIKENTIDVKVNIPDYFQVKGVPAYVESVVLNLITNAIKYRNPKKKARILINAENVNDHMVMNIADNGLGIDLDKYGEKLFGMYKTFHDQKDARGIGLFITKNQIESMGGTIEVESKVNVGTTFKVSFLKP